MSTRARRRVWASQPLRLAVLAVGAVATVVAVIAVGLVADLPPAARQPLLTYCAIGLANVWIGVVAWIRRPHNRIGALLMVGGVQVLLAAMGNVANPTLATIGFVVGQAPIAALVHLLVVFPTGRASRPARLLVIAGYTATVGIDAVRVVALVQSPLPDRWADVELAEALRTTQRSIGAVLLTLAALLVAWRWWTARHSARPGERLTSALVTVWGVAMLAYIPASANVLASVFEWSPIALFNAQLVPYAMMPFVLAVGILRGGYARSGQIDELGAWLSGHRLTRGEIRDALAVTLGDPSVVVDVHSGDLVTSDRVPSDGVASDGVASDGVASDGVASGRVAATTVEGAGGLVATVSYDPDRNPEQFVRTAAAVAVLALERDQLAAELIAEREALRASSARLVAAVDAERRRLASHLHDGIQARLVLASLHAGTLASRTKHPRRGEPLQPVEPVEPVDGGVGVDDQAVADRESLVALRDELNATIGELRDLVHGMMPAALVERGLFAAVEDLLDRVPLDVESRFDEGTSGDPIPPAVASACYFALAEAVTNAVKHAGASRLVVTLVRLAHSVRVVVADDGKGGAVAVPGVAAEGGMGLVGLGDRVRALGGTMSIESPAGSGTIVTVELPCVS